MRSLGLEPVMPKVSTCPHLSCSLLSSSCRPACRHAAGLNPSADWNQDVNRGFGKPGVTYRERKRWQRKT
jgi:hypothetical protein